MNNELMKIENVENSGFFTTLPMNTKAERVNYYNLVTSDCKQLREYVNIPLKIKDISIEKVEISEKDENEELTGVSTEALRLVIVDEKNNSYSCISKGVINAIKRIITLFGDDFRGIEVIPVLITKGKNQILSLKIN